jgi:serine/threonine protein kinase/tetratricopeptide (TPR) repeat protein
MGRVAPSIDEVFFAALEASGPEARAAYLAEVCGPDAELRRRVERMLAASPLVSNFLEPPSAAATITAASPSGELAGAVIGPYKLLEPIGEGGMGAVYMAEQTHPVRRKVALKLVKPGMDSNQVAARFEAERQALALMDHPNIAKVLDAGTIEGGRPYFVMELVRGAPITEYCDREQLSVTERLELFVLVCRAVQHAHQKGVIHRDLKPSNILVTLHDGVAVPKVIDFGIAKATGGSLTERTLFTGFAQLVGTPLYMSPEQAELSGLDVDTRSDIYSLGVLLYELLTGTTPFDSETLKKAAFDEMRRIIREEEPPRPSTRLSSLGRTLTTVSADRRADPKRLSRSLRRELDWVVMKALEKDRRRRYETANDFASDVMNYLADRPVEACPPSARYRFAKYARRNRATLTTAVLVGLALITGTAASVWQAVRATRAERRSEARYGLARRAVDEFYTQYSEDVLADQPRMTGAQRTFLEKALAYYQEFAAEGGAEPRVRAEAARASLRVGQIRASLGQNREAEASFRSAVDQTRELVRLYPTEPEFRHDLALARRVLGPLLLRTGRMKEAEAELKQAVEAWVKLGTEAPKVTKYRSDLACGYECLGDVLEATGRASEAEDAQRAALGMWETLVRDVPDVADYRRGLADSRSTLGRLMNVLGRRQEAEELLRASLELLASLEKKSGDRTWHRMKKADALFQLGVVLDNKGQPADAEKTWRELVPALESLVADFPDVPMYRWYLGGSLGNLAHAVKALGRAQEESEELSRKALVISEDLVKQYPDVPNYRDHLAVSVGDLAQSLQARGELPEARLQLQRLVALYRTNAGANLRDPRTLDNLKLAVHELMGVLTILNDHTAAAKEVAARHLRTLPRPAWRSGWMCGADPHPLRHGGGARRRPSCRAAPGDRPGLSCSRQGGDPGGGAAGGSRSPGADQARRLSDVFPRGGDARSRARASASTQSLRGRPSGRRGSPVAGVGFVPNRRLARQPRDPETGPHLQPRRRLSCGHGYLAARG